jgi:hypothetical protein
MSAAQLYFLEGIEYGFPDQWITLDRAIELCRSCETEPSGNDVLLKRTDCVRAWNAWGYEEMEQILGTIKGFQLPQRVICSDDDFADIPF